MKGNFTEERTNKPLTFTLKGINFTHAYLHDRGVAEATAREFGIGYFPGRGSMRGLVVIPLHNERGELVGYAGRSIDSSQPRYKFPTGFHKSGVLYNLHRYVDRELSTVVLVEGFFDCIRVHSAGFPSVALMGSSLSIEQERLLATHFTGVVIMLDGDDAGRNGADDCLIRLARSMWVKVITLPNGTQPDQLDPEKIKRILS